MNIPHQTIFDTGFNLAPLWCAWFSGWIDGEGCFMSQINKDSRSIACILSVWVRDDDAALIYSVQDKLHCGHITRESGQRRDNCGRKDAIGWRCNDTSACRHILMPLFDCYPLRSKKSRDYEIWRKLVISISEKNHLNENRDYVLGLCRELSDIKRYVPTIV